MRKSYKMKHIRILFIHKLIFDYRLSFYEAIAAIPGFDVTVLHSGKSMKTPDSKFSEVIIPEYSICGLLWQKSALCAAHSADIVVALFDVHYLSTIALSLLPHRFKLIYWGIGFGKSQIANKFRLYLARKADALALYMPGNASDFIRNGIFEKKIFCAPNTVYVEKPFFNEDILEKDHFLFLGSLKRRKKADELLVAFKHAFPHFSRKRYIDIIGEGEMMPDLIALVKELNIQEHVRFHGAITDNAVLGPFFRRAIAIVSPGQAGLTILHGFAHGVPIVTFRNAISGGEMENIVDGENGILYDGSVKDLSAVMIRLSNDLEYSNFLGRNAYKYYMANMTLNHLIASFENIFSYVQQKK